MALSINDVNNRNSSTWHKCNTDGRNWIFRNMFVQKHGGIFVQDGKYWKWVDPVKVQENEKLIVPPSVEETPKVNEKVADGIRIVIFEDQSGVRHEIKNISQFCKDYTLVKSAIYDLMVGKRKTHKGFKYIETIEPT